MSDSARGGRSSPTRGGDLLAEALRDRPTDPALTDGVRRWSYRELAEEADAVVAGLPLSTPGVAAALLLAPGPGAVLVLHGVWRAGAVAAPLNPRLTEHELAEALGALRPPVVVATQNDASRVASALWAAGAVPEVSPEVLLPGGSRPRGELHPSSETGGSGESRPSAGSPPPDRMAEGGTARSPGLVALVAAWRRSGTPPVLSEVPDAAAVLWTSGTTGRPRGVVIGAGALRHSAGASRKRLGLEPGDRWYASLSPAHVGGLALIIRAALLGSTLVARGSFDAAGLAALIDGGDVSHASLVPVMLRRLLDVRNGRPAPAGLRCLLVGGGPAPRPLVERALELGYPVALTYGLTEATSQVATAPPELVVRKPGTVGAPLPGVEVRVAGDGEILVRGPTLASGLLGAGGHPPDLGPLPVDADGWLHTGDLGELDGDGHLWITGRRSQRIVTGGVTVDPGEVEAVLESHPAVREAAVVGLPDPEWGERVVAAVVLRPGAAGRLDDVEALCRERLTSAKIPRRLMAVGALPRNPNGKVDRGAVRGLLEA